MNFLRGILNLKFREIITLAGIFILSPRYFLPTWRATKNTIKYSNVRYGDLHHGNNPANAYRHALWNLLLSEEIYRLTGNIEKSINWANKITDLHEDLSPNSVPEKGMDLHNNRIGREIFLESISGKLNPNQLLDQKMGKAVQVSSAADIENVGMELVYLKSQGS